MVLDTDPLTALSVDLFSGAATEVSVSPTSLDFTSADWDTEQTVTVAAIDDGEVESLSEVTITHSVDIADASYTWTGVFSPSENLTVRVYDNDEAGILISASTVYLDEGGDGTYTVQLMGSPSADVEARDR